MLALELRECFFRLARPAAFHQATWLDGSSHARMHVHSASAEAPLLALRVVDPEAEALAVLRVNHAPIFYDVAADYPAATNAFSGHGNLPHGQAVKRVARGSRLQCKAQKLKLLGLSAKKAPPMPHP